jgi:hypothetical protein
MTNPVGRIASSYSWQLSELVTIFYFEVLLNFIKYSKTLINI